MEWALLLQLLPTVKNLLQPRTVAPVVVDEKKDYTIYYIIGGMTLLILITLIIIINKNKN